MTRENLFIIFPPGLGGNHLANLFALTDRFNRNVNFSDYQESLTRAHFSYLKNLQLDIIKQNLTALKTQNNVFCGHLGEYLWFQDSELAQHFVSKKFLTILFPNSHNSVAYQRMIQMYPAFSHEYFYHEQSTLYSQQCLEQLFEGNDFFQVSADLLFSKNTTDLFDFIDKEFNTKINRSLAEKYHVTWIESVILHMN